MFQPAQVESAHRASRRSCCTMAISAYVLRDTTTSSAPGSPRRLTANRLEAARRRSRHRRCRRDRTDRCDMRTRSATCPVLNCTVHSRCVQTALNALRARRPLERTTIAGLLPNGMMSAAVRLERRCLSSDDAEFVAASPESGRHEVTARPDMRSPRPSTRSRPSAARRETFVDRTCARCRPVGGRSGKGCEAHRTVEVARCYHDPRC